MYYMRIIIDNLYFSSISNDKLFKVFVLVVITTGIALFPIDFTKETGYFSFHILMSHNVFAHVSSMTAVDNTISQNGAQIVKASGHFANNQIKDGIVTWIQGGFWDLEIRNADSKNIDAVNSTAIFDANFTMIRPDGSLSHSHIVDNFKSNNVIFAGNDIVITGISDIISNNGIEYTQVPITVHLMGKRVLGLMIDVNKTDGHFSGSNEMFGTLISGFGLDDPHTNNNSTIFISDAQAGKNNSSRLDSTIHTMH